MCLVSTSNATDNETQADNGRNPPYVEPHADGGHNVAMEELATKAEVPVTELAGGAPAETSPHIESKASVNQTGAAIELPVQAGRLGIREP